MKKRIEYMITIWNNAGSDGTSCLLRTNSLDKWLDEIIRLNKIYHFNESNCKWFKQVYMYGSEITFFSFYNWDMNTIDQWKEEPFCMKPVFMFYGIPESARSEE